jgi:hypothetical protein
MKGEIAMTTTFYRPNLIKTGIFFVAGLLLLLFVLEPPCHAQAEINPDHYETPNTEPISRAASSATSDRNTGDFRGTFTVPFDVRCAGMILPSGSYSLSVRSVAKSDEINLMPRGNDAVTIHARARSRSNAQGPSALVLERIGQRHMLTAIRLKEPGMTLYLEAKQGWNAPADAEMIPIL